jgi:GNAT superfamily N-acetyltransferase
MIVRLATFDDIPELNNLIQLSARGLSPVYYSDAQIESALKYIFGVDTQLITDGTYYIAEIDGCMAGCGGWSKRNTLFGGDQHKGPDDSLLDPAKDAARIRAFFVHPDYARRGIGTQIITLCEETAYNYGFKTTTLGATLPGVPLYVAMGYKAVENIEARMPDGNVLPIVKMGKTLQ